MTATASTAHASLAFLRLSNVTSYVGLVAEGQVLQDAISVGWSQQRGLSQGPTPFGAFALQQMSPACPVEQHFPVRRYLETFGY